ncbi:MAG: Gfo/Idh/MocA family oxidoreductase [Planctomycetota bacterium]
MARTASVKPITTAVLGLGRSGWNIHIAGIRGRADYRITDVADPLPERRAEARAEFGCNAYPTVAELLGKTKAELVIVATKSVDHGPHTIAALKAGHHVLVEKPMAMTHAEARRMLAAARAARRKLFVHQNYRFNNEAQFLKFVLSGKTPIGPVFSVVYQSYNFARRNDWQCLKKNGGGLLNNKLTHVIDTLLYATGGTVRDVQSDMRHTTDAGDCEDFVTMVLRLDRGPVITITDTTSCNADVPRWLLMGPRGTVAWYQDRTEIRYFDPRKHPPLKVQDTAAAADRKYGNAEKLTWTVAAMDPKRPSIGDYYDNIAAVLRRGGAMVVPPESVVEMTRVLEICRRQNPAFKI